jgi:hypothetical protein
MVFWIKVYKYKVVSTSFNDDIYGIEIICLQERLHVLVNILAMGSLVQGWQKPGFNKKNQPRWFFLGFIGFYWGFLGFIGVF